jgi:hypothetical protein
LEYILTWDGKENRSIAHDYDNNNTVILDQILVLVDRTSSTQAMVADSFKVLEKFGKTLTEVVKESSDNKNAIVGIKSGIKVAWTITTFLLGSGTLLGVLKLTSAI